jgi:hypothetical protein
MHESKKTTAPHGGVASRERDKKGFGINEDTQRTPEPERSWGFAFHRRVPSDSAKGGVGYLVSIA